MLTFQKPNDAEHTSGFTLAEGSVAPRLTVVGIGGAGGNAVNNMIRSDLQGVEFVVANTDAQALEQSLAMTRVQLGRESTRGLGAGSKPEVGREAAEENIDDVMELIGDCNMVFLTAGMGGGTGTGAAPVIARATRERGILTVAVITKPFRFEGEFRMQVANKGIAELAKHVDTLITIPNQNLFRISNETTSFLQAFSMADMVLHQGVQGVTDLIMRPGLINCDFSDINTVMSQMGPAIMGMGEATGENRAIEAAEAAISNPLLDDITLAGAGRVLINITGGTDLGLHEVDGAVSRVRQEVENEGNLIFGATYDKDVDGRIRVCVIASGITEQTSQESGRPDTEIIRMVHSDDDQMSREIIDFVAAAVEDEGQADSEADEETDAAKAQVEEEQPPQTPVLHVREPSQQSFPYDMPRVSAGHDSESSERASAPQGDPAEPVRTGRKPGLLSRLLGRGKDRDQPPAAVPGDPGIGTRTPESHGAQPYRGEPRPQETESLGELNGYGRPRAGVDSERDKKFPEFLRQQAN